MGLLLSHYTKLNVIDNILQKDHITFWASRFDSMNDPFDCKFAIDIVLPEAISIIKERYEKDLEDTPLFPYVISFSKKNDDFNMWRLYDSDISLVFDFNTNDEFEKIANQNIEIHGDCKYLKRENVRNYVIEEFERLQSEIDISEDDILDLIRCICFKIKEHSYCGEDEWRFISCDAFTSMGRCDPGSPDNCIITECEVPVDVGVRCVKNGRLKFYKEIKIKKDYLKKIILKTYDKNFFEEQKKDLELLLIKNNYNIDNIEILQTKTYPCL